MNRRVGHMAENSRIDRRSDELVEREGMKLTLALYLLCLLCVACFVKFVQVTA